MINQQRESHSLEEIGFNTLEDCRARFANHKSEMWRTEIIITEACNFNCPYCRGLDNDIYGQRNQKMLSLDEVKKVIDLWSKDGLRNIRFSGGEPTTHPDLIEMVKYAKNIVVDNIAISTNGSADEDLYLKLIEAGANDFSISLDSCCSEDIDYMSGTKGNFDKIKKSIQLLSSKVYTTVGCVFTPDNINKLIDTIELADSLGVHDIRIISSAQWDQPIEAFKNIPSKYLLKYPILRYRVNNFIHGRNVRGIRDDDCISCNLVLDDSVVAGDYHFPCVIYMREKGKPIGRVNDNMRYDRLKWVMHHNVKKDPICKKNCLDVCIDYNNKHQEFRDARLKGD